MCSVTGEPDRTGRRLGGPHHFRVILPSIPRRQAAARDEFAERGYIEATVDPIAERAELTPWRAGQPCRRGRPGDGQAGRGGGRGAHRRRRLRRGDNTARDEAARLGAAHAVLPPRGIYPVSGLWELRRELDDRIPDRGRWPTMLRDRGVRSGDRRHHGGAVPDAAARVRGAGGGCRAELGGADVGADGGGLGGPGGGRRRCWTGRRRPSTPWRPSSATTRSPSPRPPGGRTTGWWGTARSSAGPCPMTPPPSAGARAPTVPTGRTRCR